MKHWNDHRNLIQSRLSNRPLSLFLDFDGTLVPLRSYEEEADLSPAMEKLLNELAAHPKIQLAIVSGRPLSDLKRQIRNRRVFLAGNHGFEVSGPNLQFLHPAATEAKHLFQRLGKELREGLKHFPEAVIENKVYTWSVHYSKASSVYQRRLKRELQNWLEKCSLNRRLSLQAGRNVWELRPRTAWHKGAAMRLILSVSQSPSRMAVYMGDDLTDEDALRSLPRSGWGFKVTPAGRGPTAARSYLRNPTEVKKCLHWFKSLMK